VRHGIKEIVAEVFKQAAVPLPAGAVARLGEGAVRPQSEVACLELEFLDGLLQLRSRRLFLRVEPARQAQCGEHGNSPHTLEFTLPGMRGGAFRPALALGGASVFLPAPVEVAGRPVRGAGSSAKGGAIDRS